MDALKRIGYDLLTGLGGCLSGTPLGIPAAEALQEPRRDEPTEAAIVAVVIGPVFALVALLAFFAAR